MHIKLSRAALFFVTASLIFTAVPPAIAENLSPIEPRYALATNLANSYSPGNDIAVYQLSAAALYDYDAIWPHAAPDSLRFKVELNAGIASAEHNRAIVSANMLAVYLVESLTTKVFTPYLEAGIGVIYTDYQVEDQGLRFNFNPQLGIGTEIKADNSTYFIATRLHHISNGGLHHDNRGINSVLLQLGLFF
ncbi:MAG: acyloxyacyl hydrolase [Desulfuromonas sp.]|nr:acyloxyacyl hydrolase [Desulfuromonas sp.]